MGTKTFCIRMEVHGELFTRGLNTVCMKGEEGIATAVFEGAEIISGSGKDNKANIPLDVNSK